MIRQEITKLIEKSIKELQKRKVFLDFDIPEIKIEHPGEKAHGDYATNIALVIGKRLKQNPIEIAEKLKYKIEDAKCKIIEKVEIARPGFINFFLSPCFLARELKRILKEGNRYGSSKLGKGKTAVIDYSAPNIAKPFGIGHLRSTIIGQAIYNIYEFLGWKCIGDNHLGDWGTQFGKLIVAIKKWGDEKNLESLSVNNLEKLYVRFHQEAESNLQLEEEGRMWFKRLEEGNKEAVKIWQACVDISLREFGKIYKLLGIKIDYTFGESFYRGMLKNIINEAMRKKITIRSEGAVIIKYPEDELPPAMILKSDGATTYLTRDLATVKYRLKRWKPSLIIYEVGADQTLHFQQLFKTVELLGWKRKEKFFHVVHGLIRSEKGKFSTRRGKTVHLEEVLKEAIERAEEIIGESETGRDLSEKEKKEISEMIGIGAVKYNDLSQYHSKDIIFDWNKILNLKGNSAPYLQYTYARCQSVIKKAKLKIDPEKVKIVDLKLEEKNILGLIYEFPEVVQEAAEKFSPNLICNFIFDLAQKYNLFYDLYPIIKAEDGKLKIFRLALTTAVAQLLKNSLFLCGIKVPEKM